MNSKRLHTIKSVSEITGLSVFVIRAWENRYKAVEPQRTDTNRRLYSEEDIEKLVLLSKAVSRGYTIGNIANLSREELIEITSEKNRVGVSKESNSSVTHLVEMHLLNSCLDAINEMNAAKLDSLLLKASVEFSHPVLFENLIVPLINAVGDMWKKGTIRIASEHLFTSSVRTFLTNLSKSYRVPDRSAKIVIATPTGQHHELGALLVACIAASSGWNVVYLGANLPVEEIAAASIKLNVKAVSLSLVYPEDDQQLVEDLKRLNSMIGDIPLIVGGRAANAYKKVLETINAKIANNQNEFSSHLENIRKTNSN